MKKICTKLILAFNVGFLFSSFVPSVNCDFNGDEPLALGGGGLFCLLASSPFLLHHGSFMHALEMYYEKYMKSTDFSHRHICTSPF